MKSALFTLATTARAKVAQINAVAVQQIGRPAIKTFWGLPIGIDPKFRIIIEPYGQNLLRVEYLPDGRILGRF